MATVKPSVYELEMKLNHLKAIKKVSLLNRYRVKVQWITGFCAFLCSVMGVLFVMSVPILKRLDVAAVGLVAMAVGLIFHGAYLRRRKWEESMNRLLVGYAPLNPKAYIALHNEMVSKGVFDDVLIREWASEERLRVEADIRVNKIRKAGEGKSFLDRNLDLSELRGNKA